MLLEAETQREINMTSQKDVAGRQYLLTCLGEKTERARERALNSSTSVE